MPFPPAHISIARRVAALISGAIKSVDTLTESYEVDITDLATSVFNGDKSKTQFANGLRALIRENGKEVYTQGLEEGGIDNPELDDDDNALIQDWIDQQLESVDGFSDDTQQATRANSPDDYTSRQQGIFNRATIWAQSLRAFGGYAKASAQDNEPGTFRLGLTEKHCDTCQGNDGVRHKMKWWRLHGMLPQQPGNKNFDCGCWRCECFIEDDDGEQIYP